MRIIFRTICFLLQYISCLHIFSTQCILGAFEMCAGWVLGSSTFNIEKSRISMMIKFLERLWTKKCLGQVLPTKYSMNWNISSSEINYGHDISIIFKVCWKRMSELPCPPFSDLWDTVRAVYDVSTTF